MYSVHSIERRKVLEALKVQIGAWKRKKAMVKARRRKRRAEDKRRGEKEGGERERERERRPSGMKGTI